MASRALESFDFDDAILIEPCAAPADRFVASESPSVPRGKGLMAVKGVVVAISLEAAGAFFFFSIWQVWRFLR